MPCFFLGISCHNDNPRLINSDYIYPISYKNAKRQTRRNGFAFIEKRYHKNFEALIFTLSLEISKGQVFIGIINMIPYP